MTGRERPRRSLRLVLAELALLLIALPLLLMSGAWLYERWLVHQQQGDLGRLAASIAGAGPAEREQAAVRARTLIARLNARGDVVERSRAGLPLGHSPLGAVGERLAGERDEREALDRADAQLPPWSARPEVRAALGGARAVGHYTTPDGTALLVTTAEPLGAGGALYLVAGSHRGVRRLVAVRGQLLELVIYETVLALPLVILFGVGLVRPLERLEAAARRYPAAPLADAQLLRRRDEIGALARTLATMAEDLEGRRRSAAELGADIAHEFKNPLATIAASAELLESSKTLTPERVALCVESIAGSVMRLRRSIDDLLSLLRLDEAILTEEREAVPYGPFLDGIVAEYRRDPQAAGWTFDLELAPDAAACAPRLNRRRWSELVRNLIDNALVQPATERRIVLGARLAAGGALHTSVRDHGPGISPENQRMVFRRFFTQRPAGVAPGTGLGLAVVESVARAHGASVDVRSQPGQGAEFRVVLPT